MREKIKSAEKQLEKMLDSYLHNLSSGKHKPTPDDAKALSNIITGIKDSAISCFVLELIEKGGLEKLLGGGKKHDHSKYGFKTGGYGGYSPWDMISKILPHPQHPVAPFDDMDMDDEMEMRRGVPSRGTPADRRFKRRRRRRYAMADYSPYDDISDDIHDDIHDDYYDEADMRRGVPGAGRRRRRYTRRSDFNDDIRDAVNDEMDRQRAEMDRRMDRTADEARRYAENEARRTAEMVARTVADARTPHPTMPHHTPHPHSTNTTTKPKYDTSDGVGIS